MFRPVLILSLVNAEVNIELELCKSGSGISPDGQGVERALSVTLTYDSGSPYTEVLDMPYDDRKQTETMLGALSESTRSLSGLTMIEFKYDSGNILCLEKLRFYDQFSNSYNFIQDSVLFT